MAIGSSLTATFSEPMDAATIDDTSVTLTGPGATAVPAAVGYASGVATLIRMPIWPTPPPTPPHSTPAVSDLAGNQLGTDASWSLHHRGRARLPTGFTDTTVADFGAGRVEATPRGRCDGRRGHPCAGRRCRVRWQQPARRLDRHSVGRRRRRRVVGGEPSRSNNASLRTDAFLRSGRALEFEANFSAQNQHIGFANDFNAGNWAIFSSGADR